MPELSEFAAQSRVSAVELAKVSEVAILDENSNVFQTLLQKLASKWVEQTKLSEIDVKARKTRVYLPYALDSTCRYQLTSGFPHMDLRFVSTSMVSAAYARSVSTVVSEQLLIYSRTTGRNVILYGFDLRPSIMRNRSWAHICMSGVDMHIQSDYKSEDRELGSIWDSLCRSRTRKAPPLLTDYMTGSFLPCCTNVMTCTKTAPVFLAVLDKVDTNFRQFAMLMLMKQATVAYFSIPANKCMELKTDGPFPELGAHVVIRGDLITLVWEDDVDFQRSYTYSNYIELIARTKVVLEGTTFVKEYVTNLSGYAVYKITAHTGLFETEMPEYKSWVDPNYRDKYMLYAPVLGDGMSASDVKSWKVQQYPVDRDVFDTVFDVAITNDDQRIDQVIVKRVSSMAQNFVAQGMIARRAHPMSIDAFEEMSRAIYCRMFMDKYRAGKAVGLYAPHARAAAEVSRQSFISAFCSYASNLVSRVTGVADVVAGPLAKYVAMLEFGKQYELPQFAECCGYVTYSDSVSSNPAFTGWLNGTDNPYHGFSPALPGSRFSSFNLKAIYDEPYDVSVLEGGTQSSVMCQLASFSHSVKNTLSAVTDIEFFDPEELREDFYVDEILVNISHPSTPLPLLTIDDREDDVGEESPEFYRPTEAVFDHRAYTEEAEYIVSKVCGEHSSGHAPQVPFIFNAFLAPNVEVPYVAGRKSVSPVSDLMSALSILFPESQAMKTQDVESQRHYGDLEVLIRSIRTKIDISKLNVLKPESFFLPAVRGHLLPNIHDTTVTAIQTVAKRNADTPYNIDPMDAREVWERVWQAMLDVYYVPEARYFLDNAPLIEPDENSVREWIARQDVTKIKRLLGQDDYSFGAMESNTTSMQFMLKAKLKPELDASYETSLKLPQSIQFDQTGRSVAVLTPVIRQKVKREQFLLKPNMLVMQRKSFDDIHNFINQFDHRPNSRGARRYIEIDQTMFDKAQVRELAQMYLAKCEKFGVPARFLDFIDQKMFKRFVSSAKTGVGIQLEDQNPSGAAFTLDRNNDVSEMSLAMLLCGIKEQIEFLMFMGDDVTVAIRGDVDITPWEREMSRFFNLTSKVNIHDHGYFCSFDIVHLPGGRSTLTRDLVKAAVQLMDQSVKDRELLYERWVSFRDSFRNVGNGYVQDYLVRALTFRWSALLQRELSSEAFDLLVKVMTAIADSYEQFQLFFPDVKVTRYY